jgi:hypothetical protein
MLPAPPVVTEGTYFCRFKVDGCKRKGYIKNGQSLWKHEAECQHNKKRVAVPRPSTIGPPPKKNPASLAKIAAEPRQVTTKPNKAPSVALTKKARPASDDDYSDDDYSDDDYEKASSYTGNTQSGSDEEFVPRNRYKYADIPELPNTQSAPLPPLPPSPPPPAVVEIPVVVAAVPVEEEDSSDSDGSSVASETGSVLKRRRKDEHRERKVIRQLRRQSKRRVTSKPKLETQFESLFLRPVMLNPLLAPSTIRPIQLETTHHSNHIMTDLYHKLKRYYLEGEAEEQAVARRLQINHEATSDLVQKMIDASNLQVENMMKEMRELGIVV